MGTHIRTTDIDPAGADRLVSEAHERATKANGDARSALRFLARACAKDGNDEVRKAAAELAMSADSAASDAIAAARDASDAARRGDAERAESLALEAIRRAYAAHADADRVIEML
jgi:hypothetical protein